MNKRMKLRLGFVVVAISLGSTQITYGQYFHAKLTVSGSVTVSSNANARAAAAISDLRMDIVRKGALVAFATISVSDGDLATTTAGALRAALTLVDKGIAGAGAEVLILRNRRFDVFVCSGNTRCASGKIGTSTTILGQSYGRVSKTLRKLTKIKVSGSATGTGSVTLEVRRRSDSVILSSATHGVVSGDSAETSASGFRALLKGSANLSFGITSSASGNIIVATVVKHKIRGCTGAGPCSASDASSSGESPALGASDFPLTFLGQLYEVEELMLEIPAVSQWGLFALVLLVLSAGTVVILRRQSSMA